MKQVILNLLSNAIDFSPQGEQIELITKKCTEKGKPEVIHIEIKDNGQGIPAEQIDKVFDPYFTTKHKSDLHKGTGLGLFIAHQNMQDHDGSIEVKNNVDLADVSNCYGYSKISINGIVKVFFNGKDVSDQILPSGVDVEAFNKIPIIQIK